MLGGTRFLLSKYVYVTLFLLYALGSFTGQLLAPSLIDGYILFLFSWFALVMFILLISTIGRVVHTIVLPAVYLLIFLTSFSYSYTQSVRTLSSPLEPLAGESVVVRGVVTNFPRYSASGSSFFLKVTRIVADKVQLFHPRGLGKIYVFVAQGEEVPLSYQTELEIRGVLAKAPDPQNFGGFSMKDYLRPFGVSYQIFVPSPKMVRVVAEPNFAGRFLYKLKEKLVRRAKEVFPSPYSELFLGLTLGDSAIFFPREIKDTFRKAGLTHLLVVSGTQISLFFLLVGILLLRFESPFTRFGKVTRILKYPIIFLLIFSYCILTGFEPSIQRAFIVSVVILVAHYFLHETDSLNVLGQAGLIILILRPAEVLSVSFQLTFTATLGLLLALRVVMPIISIFSFWLRPFVVLIATTTGAQIMVFPLILYYFNQLSPWGIVSNLVAIPISFLIICFAIGFYLLGPIPVIGTAISWLIMVGLKFLYWWASSFANLPGSGHFYVPMQASVVLVSLALLFIGFSELAFSVGMRRVVSALSFAGLASLIILSASFSFTRTLPFLRVLYLPSGSASLLITKTRDGIVFLDFPSSEERQAQLLDRLSSLLMKSGISKIEMVVLLGEHLPPISTWQSFPIRTDGVLEAKASKLYFLHGRETAIPTSVKTYFNQSQRIVLFSIDLGHLNEVIVPTTYLSGEEFNVQLPSSIGNEARSKQLTAVVVGSRAKRFQSKFKSFLKQNAFDALILQGRGKAGVNLNTELPNIRLFSQNEKREIRISSTGEITYFSR